MIRSNNFPKLVAKWVAVLSLFGLACYPVIIAPMLDPTEYKKLQEINREGMDREKIQPGNMKIWSDPFGRK